MPLSLEDEDGRPWTASTSLGWIVLIIVLTSGIAAMALGLYLSLWIRSKGRSALPLYGFVTIAFICSACAMPLKHLMSTVIAEQLATVASLVWIASTFALRHQIKRYYKESEGWDVEKGPFFTFFFSVIYINYCLNPITFDERNPSITLNLRK